MLEELLPKILRRRFGMFAEEVFLNLQEFVLKRSLAGSQHFAARCQACHRPVAPAACDDQTRHQRAVGEVGVLFGVVATGVVVSGFDLSSEIRVEEIEAIIDHTHDNLGITLGHFPGFIDLQLLKQRLLAGIWDSLGRGGLRCPDAPREHSHGNGQGGSKYDDCFAKGNHVWPPWANDPAQQRRPLVRR